MASRARDKIDAAGQQIKCGGTCADDTAPSAKGLLKTDGVAREAGGKFVRAGDDGFVDQLPRHPGDQQIAEAEFLSRPEIDIDAVPK